MSFADSFWTSDYDSGFKILFDQLYQGVNENEDFIQLFTKRMESELIYGTQLESIQNLKLTSKRQTNDDYVSSIKNSYQKINENFSRQGEYHLQIASNIRLLVLDPFTKWCKEHKQRVEYSESVVFDKYKAFKSGKSNLDKLQKRYFNRCRMLEEFKSHYSEDEISEELKDLEFADNVDAKDVEEDNEDNGVTYDLGGKEYNHRSLNGLLTGILKNIELKSHKVPILGTYNNVSSGGAITQWLLDNTPELKGNIAKAESFGQDLVNNGFIRLIGSMSGGKNFINSSQFFYQWKPIVFEITKLPEMESSLSDNGSASAASNAAKGMHFAEYLEDMKQAIGVTSIDYSDRSQLSKLVSEVNSLDTQYFKSTIDLDKIRCELEEIIMDHLTFMQKCELDRLKAIKKVTFDFIASFANKVNQMKQICDELLVLEETINPINDLKFLIENYATGKFKPHVILYDNYYNSNIKQTFGVDLTVKSRLDRKVVPVIIQCILSHLDNVYPDLVNDQERINLWTMPIHLTQVHQLRFQLNDDIDPSNINKILSETHPLIITNVFKLYFMELPDSVIPHDYYDLIKSLYQNYPVNNEDSKVNESRITGLQNVLVDLPKCSLATLDAILTHLSRLIHIIGSKNTELAKTFQFKLSKEFGNLILKPKMDLSSFDSGNGSSNYVNDKHQYSFMNDLFEYKEIIFKELRRRNSSRSNNPTRESSTKSMEPIRAKSIEASKTRLESKLQKAVYNSKKLPGSETDSKAAKNKGLSKSTNSSNGTELSTQTIPSKGDPPSTPPPQAPKKSAPNSLKRSTSPNKKKLNSYLGDASSDKNSSRPATNIVSSKPMKKDIVLDNGENSSLSGSPSGSYSDLSQPKFAQNLGRRTSVKDLKSKFDSPTPPPDVPLKDKHINKKDSKDGEVIVVD